VIAGVMASVRKRLFNRLQGWLDPATVWGFLVRERTRYVISWVAALIGTFVCILGAWKAQDDPKRADGNGGHVSLDFSGQWLLGHLLVRGEGRYLYERNHQRAALVAAYPLEDQDPEQTKSDAEWIMWAMMGNDDEAYPAAASFLAPLAATGPLDAAALLVAEEATDPGRAKRVVTPRVGGPLYPPINAFVYSPLGLLPPRVGYRLAQVFGVVLIFVAAAGVRLLSRGRIWWPVAVVAIMLFPGIAGAIALGQNPVLSLAILTWGWLLLARGRQGWGGIVWGLFAYKPVWAMSFFLVPILTRRWRMALAMLATGTTLAVLTPPIVGWHAWLDWLMVGREANQLYTVDENWIDCSRDLLSLPRRWLLDFSLPLDERDANWLPPALIGWCLLLGVWEITIRLACLRWGRPAPVKGPGAAFVLLGAWAGCYHFMYYDTLLAVLPLLLLFTEPRRYLEPILVAIVPVGKQLRDVRFLRYFEARPASESPPAIQLRAEPGSVCVLNRMIPTLFALLILTQPFWHFGRLWIPPGETCLLLIVWLWCGGLWLWNKS
jgi:hypothetical protein